MPPATVPATVLVVGSLHYDILVEAETMGAGQVCCLASAFDAAAWLASRVASVIVTAGAQGLAAWTEAEDRIQLPPDNACFFERQA